MWTILKNGWFDGAGAIVARRWLVLLAASALLHVLLLRWIDDGLEIPSLPSLPESLALTTLRYTDASPSVVTHTQGTRLRRKDNKRNKGKPRTERPKAVQDVPVAAADTNTLQAASNTTAPTSLAPEDGSSTHIADEPATDANSTSAPAPASSEPQYIVSPPPSVVLKYDVEKITHKGDALYGHGKISWWADDNGYVIDGNAGILFITALTFKSEGDIDSTGVAPILYSEKRFRKSATNTHFHRERNTISFSASEISYPRKGGEQDRASIIWQLAGIGRGDSEKILPDAEINVFVAGARDGEIWRIHVLGQEDIETGTGKMNTWHLVRAPRTGSYDQQLDIWLAPQHDWYPVRLRYTETNGDYLNMLLSDMTFPTTH